jgi:hypothetical protein
MDGVSPEGWTSAADVAVLLADIDHWGLNELPRLNRTILAGSEQFDQLSRELSTRVLSRLPDPAALTAVAAQRLVVLLGLSGASVARHFQEADPSHRAIPEHAFDHLSAGPHGVPFVRYFGALADRTGTGHAHRDSFASLVRWNVPTAEVWWAGERLAVLPSVFDDGLVRTYTAAPDEQRFFGLLKGSEAVETAVNDLLLPLSAGTVDISAPEAVERVGEATALMVVLRRLNAAFTALPATDGLRVAHFMDVFRQYAVHWRHGDAPPSGAMDPQALARDLLLGIALPGYADSLRRIFPGLLMDERQWLETLIARQSVSELALARAGLDPSVLAEANPITLARITTRHPILAALHLLLNAHARFAGVHLMMTKKFLFNPQRERDADGRGDAGVVSNRIGTTGMDERRLESLTHARKEHLLAPFHHLPAAQLEESLKHLVDLPGLRRRTDQEYLRTVRFPDARGTDLGMPDADHPPEHDHHRHRPAGGAPASIPARQAGPGTAVPTAAEADPAIVKRGA